MTRPHPSVALGAILDPLASLAEKLAAWRRFGEFTMMGLGYFHKVTTPMRPVSNDIVVMRQWRRHMTDVRRENENRLTALLYTWTTMQRIAHEEPHDPDPVQWARDIESFLCAQYRLTREEYAHITSGSEIRAFVRERGAAT